MRYEEEMISEKKIEEAATEYAEDRYSYNPIQAQQASKGSFQAGARFAINELVPKLETAIEALNRIAMNTAGSNMLNCNNFDFMFVAQDALKKIREDE